MYRIIHTNCDGGGVEREGIPDLGSAILAAEGGNHWGYRYHVYREGGLDGPVYRTTPGQRAAPVIRYER